MRSFIRIVKAHKGSSFITILGFATGLAAAMLLLIFIQHELSYDRHWENGERIYRANVVWTRNDRTVEHAICRRNAYTEVPNMVPAIESAVQFYRTFNPELHYQNQRFRNLGMFYVDSTFFKVFRMQAVAGDLSQALKMPDALVINQRTAEQVFGESNPIGQMVLLSEFSLPESKLLGQIAAVVPDLPKTSHFDFDVLIPMSANAILEHLGGLEFFTYYLLYENAPRHAARQDIETAHTETMREWAQRLGMSSPPGTNLLPLRKIYLHSGNSGSLGPTGDPQAIRIFALLTGLILVIAIANFVNLYLVQTNRRALETGVRKTLGATRFQLVRQFLFESFLLSGIALLVALLLASLLIEPFGDVMRRSLSMNALLQPTFFLSLVGLFFLISLLAGLYPAWVLSRQQPVHVLKGIGTTGKPKQVLRKSIVLAQFAICMLLLTNLLVLQKQFDFMNNRPLGFDAKNVIAYQNLSPQVQQAFPLIKNELQQYADIVSVTGAHSRPGQGASGQSIKVFGKQDNDRIGIREVRIQPDYLKTYGMELRAGRSFEANRSTDRNAVILNEAAARALGLNEPIGASIIMFSEPMEVIGVVKDYHYSSLRDPIQPELFTFYKDQILNISIRVNSADPQRTISRINQVLTKYDAEYTPNYVFLQDAFAAMYGGEYRLIQLVTAGSVIALVLTILGLSAITAISAQQRIKEIGIRKAIGADVREIVQLMVGTQIITLFITTCIAGLLALWIIQRWLQNYAYRIEVSFWYFVASGTVILLVALAVTAVISFRASRANPVEALRYE
ncbi:ABC transporter permease [candidate division KSB1 bacterium]|nr:ABC transporter permease [candidate division KSB1 bacterium]